MEPVTTPFDDTEIRAQLARVKYDQKWDILKPVIRKLRMEDDRNLSEIITEIENIYGFKAQESQYKYQFRKWNWKKYIPSTKKEALCKIRQTRAQAGRATLFEYQGKSVDENKLRRHMKNMIRRGPPERRTVVSALDWKVLTGTDFVLGDSIFLNWRRPYGTMPDSMGQASSPMSMSTPSDIVVGTPPANNAPSPSGAPSPLTQIRQKNEAVNRAYMLVEGQFTALVNSMRRDERETMSKLLYQFWMFSFKTAKYWGRGPRNWTADILNFESHRRASLFHNPRSPIIPFGTMFNRGLHSVLPQSPVQNMADIDLIPKPSPLCRWSIHYHSDLTYDPCKSRTPSPEPEGDGLDERVYKPWPSSENEPTLQQTLALGLASNNFSDVETSDLPIALTKVVQASESTKHGFLEETLGFSIMTRNFEMVGKILYEHRHNKDAIERIRKLCPLHLAITYLDGSQACCMVVETLLGRVSFRTSDTNKLGHTILDSVMMAILKAHTYTKPGTVDNGLRDEKSFPGEEVDICGRFDADSDNVRTLVAACKPSIPFSWKHKFCHTSAKAICHSIQALFDYEMEAGVFQMAEIRSGLFLKHCVCCGLKMQLTPLHTLVLIAFELGQSGAKDEDMFGIIAVLLCFVQHGVDPLVTVDVSMTALFPEESNAVDPIECSHSQLRAGQVAESAPRRCISEWPDKARIGWDIFCHILQIAERGWSRAKELEEENPMFKECSQHFWPMALHALDERLPVLHAAVQTELLTYRRLREEDPWISPSFDMPSVLRSLKTDQPFSIDLIRKDMMQQPICKCGGFMTTVNYSPRAEHVMRYHFSNLEDWSRTTFLPDAIEENSEGNQSPLSL